MSEIVPRPADPIPAFAGLPADRSEQITRAVQAWKPRTPSPHTRPLVSTQNFRGASRFREKR